MSKALYLRGVMTVNRKRGEREARVACEGRIAPSLVINH